MALADIVPVVLSTRIERRRLTAAEKRARWISKPGRRAHFNRYRRAWRQQRRAAGLEVT